MKKKSLLIAVAAMVSSATFAGGLLTNTNQNAVFLRNPARGAVIDIDGVYSNPAGIAFMPQGFHLSVNWQAAWQKREITSTRNYFQLNGGNATKKFVGEAAAPVIPSLQFAYVINDKWSVSAQFAVGGGGGKCEFNNGLPMFEDIVGGALASTGVAGYGMNQNFVGEQYFYALQVGATYKIIDNLSVFAGARGVMANMAYEGVVGNVTASHPQLTQGNAYPASDYLNGLSQYLASQGDVAGATTAGTYAQLFANDLTIDCSQSALGITPVLGVDYKLGNLNLAAKYEFRTKIELENEANNAPALAAIPQAAAYADGAKVRSDIPALMTLGAQYAIIPSVRVAAGYHMYFDKDAKGSATDVEKNTWEVNFGAEWDITKNWLVSAGVQRTQYGFGENMNNTNFNVSSTALAIGFSYKFNKLLTINAGYMHSFFEEEEMKTAMGTDLYTRKNDACGIGLNFAF